MRAPWGASTVLAVVALLAATGSAPPAGSAAAAEEQCVERASGARSERLLDHRQFSRRYVRRVERDYQQRLAVSLQRSRARGMTMRIPVHAHVVDGTGRREQGPSRQGVLRQLAIINDAYSGGQGEANVATPLRFYLASYERVVNDWWHNGALDDRADRAMRRNLHRGGPDALNLYFSQPQVHDGSGGVVLGYSSFPWQVKRRPLLDGVSIHLDSMPGGSARGYNRGDSAVHEIGHWLGLFHTFEGGCSPRNDMVSDTPAAAQPSFTCEEGRDSCPADPGPDPVHNFLDYSYDSCMNRFTAGQVERMAGMWLAYRTP